MSTFEKIYQIDPERERDHQREKHPSIELSDKEYLENKGFVITGNFVKFNNKPHFDDEPIKVSKEMEQEGWIYREPPPKDLMSPALKEKFKKARKICQDTKVIDLQPAEPPKIPMNLEMPKPEKTIKESKRNAKSKSKNTKEKSKRNNSKSNKSAMANLQAELS